MRKNSLARESPPDADVPGKGLTVTQLGRLFGLSRTTLLYYDRIGLLSPAARTGAGYRRYFKADRQRLERICGFRRAGLALEEIRAILSAEGKPPAAILERRFHEIGEEIRRLKEKQELLSQMITGIVSAKWPAAVDKALWVQMLRAAGMDEKAMARWHAEFEQRAPEAHREFLLSLGIPEAEALEIRKWSQITAERLDSEPPCPESPPPASPAAEEPGKAPAARKRTSNKSKKGAL
jgi:DNA-binding transcriptional MerR regulator